jgi:poly [ADP-ribose] polymerase
MASNKPVDKLADGLKGLVIGASGNIPGHLHGCSSQLDSLSIYQLLMKSFRFHLDQIKDMVEKCGAKFERLKVSECTHLVTTEDSVRKKLKKSMILLLWMLLNLLEPYLTS